MLITRVLLALVFAALSSITPIAAQPGTPGPGAEPCAGPHRDPAAIVAAISPPATPEATPAIDHAPDNHHTHETTEPVGGSSPIAVEPMGTPRLLQPALPPGTPAPNDVVAGLTETMQRYLACANAGDVIGLMSLVSDDFLRHSFAGSILTEADLQAYAEAGRPVPVEQRRRLIAIRDARHLADGRVAALVDTAPVGSDNPAATVTDLVTFTQVDGRWLVAQYLAGVTHWYGPNATPSP